MKKKPPIKLPASPPTIPRVDIERAQRLCAEIRRLEKDLAEVKAAYEPLEGDLIARTEAGLKPELGAPGYIIEVKTRRNVAWRTEFEARLGKPAAEAVLAAAPELLYKHLRFGNGK